MLIHMHIANKVSKHILVTYLKQTNMIEWHMVRCVDLIMDQK